MSDQIRVTITERNNQVTVTETEVLVRVIESDIIVTVGESSGSGVAASDGTLVVTADATLTEDYDRYRVYNTGAAQATALTLPASATLDVGWRISLRVTEELALRLAAAGSDVIVRAGETASTTYLESAALGAALDVEYAGSGMFIVTNSFGPWDSP